MNRCVPLLLCGCIAPAALSQMTNGPAAPPPPPSYAPAVPSRGAAAQPFQPQTELAPVTVEAESDGKCRDARPGDTVNFTLTVEGVENARAVYGELQMREGRAEPVRTGGLPMPDYRNLSGGGLGSRDPQKSAVYRFSFRVPSQLYSGLYRGTGVVVTADRPVTFSDRDRPVEVTRQTREQVRSYCLNVMSGFGGEGRPRVTDFQPGDVQRPAPLPSPR